jgi:hypothetical protein
MFRSWKITFERLQPQQAASGQSSSTGWNRCRSAACSTIGARLCRCLRTRTAKLTANG